MLPGQAVINEFTQLISYLTNISIHDVLQIFEIDTNKYDFSIIVCSVLFLTILFLWDKIHTHWLNTLQRTNSYNTKKYNNTIFLILYETLKYITQLPNLLTLIIGIIQAICTFQILRKRFMSIDFYLVSGNFINISVSISCWLFAITNEYTKYKSAKTCNEKINSNLINLSNHTIIRADKLEINNNTLLICDNISPAFIKITNILYDQSNANISIEQMSDFDTGFYDDKESTGENVSKSFRIGDTIPFHRVMTRPNSIVHGSIVKYVDPITFEHQVTTPTFMNGVRFILDVYAIILLFLISLSISASAIFGHYYDYEYDLNIILKHIIAGLIAANILIPSMRMTLLYNVYNLVLSFSFSTIKVNSYDSFTKMDHIQSAIFDKTGTITEEHLSIHKYYQYEHHSILRNNNEWSSDEISFALAMANSESNMNNDKQIAWGTSPEENKILEYWYSKGVQLIFNPVKQCGSIIFKFPNRT